MLLRPSNLCLLFVFLLALTVISGSLLAQQEPPQSQPQEAAKTPTEDPPVTTPFSPFLEWIRSVLTWWIVVPVVAVALGFWFVRISTSPSRDPSKDMP
jgi:hypothetical protein